MNKKFKIAIPFAVLALSCGVAAGALTGCKNHTHSYTEWGHDETWHWKECECGEIDESSKEEHEFVVGECECGATQTIEEVKYGSASGQVKIHKLGEYLTDYSDVTVTTDDDDVVCSIDKTTGKFTVTDAVVGRNYTLTVSKPGYVDYSAKISVAEGDDTVIGGTRGAVLEYRVFKSLVNYDDNLHDYSKVNEEVPTIGVNGDGGKSLDVISTDLYDDVSVSIHAKDVNGGGIQGIVLKFTDGTYAILNVNIGERKLQYRPEMWGMKSVWGVKKENSDDDNWIEYTEKSVVTDSVVKSFKSDGGLDIRLIRKGGDLYSFLDDRFIGKVALPTDRAADKINVGFFSHNVKANAVWNYEITETVPEMKSTLELQVDQPAETTACTVTANTEKRVFEFNEQVELTFTAAEGYKFDGLTVGGENMFGAVKDGKLTIDANKINLPVVAKFIKKVPAELNVTVKGKKLGKTVNLESGTTVKFNDGEYEFAVDNGTISNASVVKGNYIVHVDGYFDKQVKFDESLNEIVLEYDLMENLTREWGWGDEASLAEQNDGKLTQSSGATQWISSKDSYDSVAITATVVLGGNRQGVFIRFKGDKYADDKYAMIQKEKDDKVTWNSEGNIWGNGSNLFSDIWTDYVNPLTAADKAAIADGEYELTLVRDGVKLHVFINGKYYDTKTLDVSYAGKQCYVGVYCTDTPAGAERTFKIEDASVYLKAATVTDETAADAKGRLSGVPAEAVRVGDTVTLTIETETGFKLKSLTVGGADVTAKVTGTTYTFVVTGDTVVAAEFTEIIPGSINAQVIGYKFAVNGNALTAADAVTLSASGFEDVSATLTANGDNLVLSVNSIAAGEWTVSIAGYKPVQITVEENGKYTTAIVLQHEEEFSLVQPWGTVGSVIAADGSVDLTITNEAETAVSSTTFGDVAVTVNLSGTNMVQDGNTGTQGIVFRFSDGKIAILRMEHKDKIQFAEATGWYQSCGSAEGSAYQDLIFFKEGDKYLTAFDAGTLKLTAVRKGATIYAILTVDGVSEIIGCRTFADKYLTDPAKVGMCCDGTKNGAAKTWKLATGDADAALAAATPAVGTDKVSYLGTWTENEGTLAVSGKGVIMFNAAAGTVKESVKINISAANGTKEQGIVYNFADGKYVAIRYQNEDGKYKVQFTMDTVLFTNGSLINWGFDYYMTAVESAAFDGAAGIDLTLVRDGNTFYVLLGDRMLGSQTVDADKYENADGNMGIMIWEGKNAAFAYEHKTGNEVVNPTTHAVTASFDGEAHGYALTYTQTKVVDGGTLTLTVKTDNADSAWKHFPSAITVDGTPVDFSTVVRESLGANRCQYTLTVANVTADKTITVTVTEGTKVDYDASVNDATMGSIKCDMTQTDPTSVYHNLYYWNDLCTLTVTANEGYELESLVIGEGADAVTITKDSENGWTKDGQVYTYGHLVTGNIKVVANFKAVTTPAE